MICYRPKSLSELKSMLPELTKDSRIVAGGTDYIIEASNHHLSPDILLYPGDIKELWDISIKDDVLRIGAMAPMNKIHEALKDKAAFAAISDGAAGVGSPQIRSKATMAGNVCNASPAGDSLPISLLYDCVFNVIDPSEGDLQIRAKDFFLGPKKTVLGKGAFLYSIEARASKDQVSAFGKTGFRSHVSIARTGLGIRCRTDEEGIIKEIYITLGAVANTPIRAYEAEELLIDCDIRNEASFNEAGEIIAHIVESNCRPKNRLYKTVSSKGLWEDVTGLLKKRWSTSHN